MPDQKACVACAEQILVAAKLCKHCGTRQDDNAFSGEQPPALMPHTCDHPQTFAELASEQPGPFWGGPKFKPYVSDHGDERVVASITKVKYSMEGAFEEMLIVTDKSVIFGGYGSFGGSEIFPIEAVKTLWLSDALIGTGFSDTIGLILDFETEDDSIEPRVIPLGTNPRKAMDALRELSATFAQIAAHLPVAHTGETVTGGYHTNFSVGFFREI